MRTRSSARSSASSASSSVSGRWRIESNVIVFSVVTITSPSSSASRARLARARGWRTIAKQAGDLGRSERWAEQKALAVAAPVTGQELELPLGLDAFSDRVEPEPLRDRQDGAADRLIVAARVELGDEGAVDLEHVDRKAAKVTQARISRSEIVDREPHPGLFQAAQARLHSIGILHQRALRELELDQRWVDAVSEQSVLDLTAEARLVKMNRGDVHGDARRIEPGALPGFDLLTGLL